jgi:hypothetical protein
VWKQAGCDYEKKQEKRGIESERPTRIEAPKMEPAIRPVLLKKERSDEEPAQHEEDVDAQYSARKNLQVVMQKHDDGRNGPKTVEDWNVAQLVAPAIRHRMSLDMRGPRLYGDVTNPACVECSVLRSGGRGPCAFGPKPDS